MHISKRRRGCERWATYGRYMAELMPPDGEEFEGVDEHAHAGDVPKCKYHDGEDNHLYGSEPVLCKLLRRNVPCIV